MLIANIDKLHTTVLGAQRIKKNLNIDCDDAVQYCAEIIMNKDCKIVRKGKNWYAALGNVEITVNAYSYTIITAHIIK